MMLRSRNQRGQAMTETVIMMPVVLLLFLGMYYFKMLADTRMRAIEAARYLTWEHVWHVRENNTDRNPRSQATLEQELRDIGLGRHLVSISTGSGKSIGDYAGSVSGKEPSICAVPTALSSIFEGVSVCGDTSQFEEPPDNSAQEPSGSTSASIGPISMDIPIGGMFDGILGSVLDVAGTAAFATHDFFADQTNWKTEADRAVFTPEVVYGFDSSGMFAFIGQIRIKQKSAILSHPLNIVRSNNTEELRRLIGSKANPIGGQNVGEALCDTGGHIFDLWMYPSGIPEALRVPKCVIAGIGRFMSFFDFLPGVSAGFQMPSGTLKEYPELDGAPSSSGGDSGGGTGSGFGGGNPGSGGLVPGSFPGGNFP